MTHDASDPLPETPRWVQALGWYGMLAVTVAYALNARSVLDDGAPYLLLNATGAAALLVLCRYKRDWPTFALEVVWLAVSVRALVAL